jgi:hypothetical protein
MEHKILHEFPTGQVETDWRDLLNRLELPSHYNAPEFFLEPHWAGRKPFSVLAVEGVRVAGVLTGIHDGEQVISGLATRPQVAVDPRMDAATALEALVEGLIEEAGRKKLLTVYTWPSLELPAFAGVGFRRRQLLGSVMLDLTLGADALFQQFPKDRRRNIRYAEKHGITVRVAAGREDFLRAYEVYVTWDGTHQKDGKGAPRTFENFETAQLLAKNRRLFLAELDGKLIAINMFRFYPGGLFESAANYSLDEFLHLKPNDLLQWKGIEWACGNGLRRHSLGGAHPFLARFGGTIVPIIRYRLDRTLLRKHDLRESVVDLARKKLREMPPSVQEKVRGALGKKTARAANPVQALRTSEPAETEVSSAKAKKARTKTHLTERNDIK